MIILNHYKINAIVGAMKDILSMIINRSIKATVLTTKIV